MKKIKCIPLLIALFLLLGCSQNDNDFRLGLLWESDDLSDTPASLMGIITADDLLKVDTKMRLDLTRRNGKLGIKPIQEVSETATFEYYQIPPNHRTEHSGRINFGYVWVKPHGKNKKEWTNTQLWVSSTALAEGKLICHNIGGDNPWAFYLPVGTCEAREFDICDDSIPKLGLIYSEHYDIVLLSTSARALDICE